MTTKTAGGHISGRIALTLEAASALNVGDPVKITGNYTCDKADATAPTIGRVVVANKVRLSTVAATTYPSNLVPGDVTVEVRGHMVTTQIAGVGGFTAGGAVKTSATGTYVPGAVTDASFVGYALTTALAAATFDLLWV